MAISGCASYAQYQEADVVEKGETKQGVGIGASIYQVKLETKNSEGEVTDEATAEFTVPQVSFWARHGVSEKLELHGHAWLPLGASVGAKYQLIGDRKTVGPALSLGADIGYLTVSSGDSEATIIDIYVPVYTGYRMADNFAVYFTPKYIMKIISGDTENPLLHNIGGTGGIAIGSKTQILAEASYFYDAVTNAPAFHAGVGLTY